MKIFNKSFIPSFKRFSSVQVPYFFHTTTMYPYQLKESKNFYINFEKRQVIKGGEKDIWFVNENFLKEINNFKSPRESILIFDIPEEEEIFQIIKKSLPYFFSTQSGVILILNKIENFVPYEDTLNLLSVHNFILFKEEIKGNLKNVKGFLYPFFPGFSDDTSLWSEHLSYLKNIGVSHIFPFMVYFDSITIKNFFEISKPYPNITKKIEELFHTKSRKEYVKNLWQKFLPFARNFGFQILFPLPQQSGELYENKLLSQRAFFLWYWLLMMERDIEAWQFHRLGFRLWNLSWPIKEVFKEGHLSLFELNFLEDYLKGEKYLYPDEEIWL